jgi:hypothetical protein
MSRKTYDSWVKKIDQWGQSTGGYLPT